MGSMPLLCSQWVVQVLFLLSASYTGLAMSSNTSSEVVSDVASIAVNTDILVMCCTALLTIVAIVAGSVCCFWPWHRSIGNEKPCVKHASQDENSYDSYVPVEEYKRVCERLEALEKERNKTALAATETLKYSTAGQTLEQVLYSTPDGRCYHANQKCRGISSKSNVTERRPCKICVH